MEFAHLSQHEGYLQAFLGQGAAPEMRTDQQPAPLQGGQRPLSAVPAAPASLVSPGAAPQTARPSTLVEACGQSADPPAAPPVFA